MEIAVLEDTARKAMHALESAKDAERDKKNKPLLGKHFKFRNCYSCPEKPSHYWWVYYKVLAVDGAQITVHRFETDRRGKMTVDFKDLMFWWHGPDSSYQPTTAADFNKAWRAFQKRVSTR